MLTRKKKRVLRDLKRSFSRILASHNEIDMGGQLELADAFFLKRLLLERNPRLEDELPTGVDFWDVPYREFLKSVITCEEFAGRSGFPPPGQIWLTELERFRFWFNTTDREMGIRMAIGRYEPGCVDLITKFVKPGMRCIDVGASTGFYTCLLASLAGPTGYVYAFEPRPASVELLEKNVAENHYGDVVEIHESACSDKSGVLTGSHASEMYIAGKVKRAEKVQ